MTKKTVLLGISGGIAVYKACELTSLLIKQGFNVEIIMTENATKFVQPLTFETLTGNRVVSYMFDKVKDWEIEHISLAKKADIFVVVPATANVISKFATGLADDMLTTTFMASKAHKVVCPAMNTNMYESFAVQENLNKLEKNNIAIINPDSGRLACGDTGKGKLAQVNQIFDYIVNYFNKAQDYKGKTVLVTAGATLEDIDGVRFISNHSSGKMGLEIAKKVKERGGKVIFVAGRVSVDIPNNLDKVVSVKSTADMYKAVMDNLPDCDIVIKSAAPADYTIKPYDNKIKSQSLTLELTKTVDIAKEVGKIKGNKKLVVFSAETCDLIKYATGKLKSKNADLVVANDVTQKGAGFNTDTNIVTLITENSVKSYDKMLKSQVADKILNKIIKL